MKTLTIVLAVAASLAAGCSKAPATGAAAAAPAVPASEGGAPPPIAASPAHDSAPGQPAVETVAGPVLETMDASTYTYVRVKTDKGDLWAASGHFDVKVGDRVVVPLESPMENFRSSALGRDFPLIYFASNIAREGDAGTAAQAQLPPGHRQTVPPPKITEKIPQPEGGRTVGSVWSDRKALAGKPLTVRGMVVKFNGGIMGRNWVHLQDGTGSADASTNDLTVTTDETVKVGDIVTFTGTLALDKDFGAGYTYAVILEAGKLKK